MRSTLERRSRSKPRNRLMYRSPVDRGRRTSGAVVDGDGYGDARSCAAGAVRCFGGEGVRGVAQQHGV